MNKLIYIGICIAAAALAFAIPIFIFPIPPQAEEADSAFISFSATITDDIFSWFTEGGFICPSRKVMEMQHIIGRELSQADGRAINIKYNYIDIVVDRRVFQFNADSCTLIFRYKNSKE